jgi:hypothetical protein
MSQVLDDHFLFRYRELLDAEEEAFDELEHASEDGDRSHYDQEWQIWLKAIAAKVAYLESHEIPYRSEGTKP